MRFFTLFFSCSDAKQISTPKTMLITFCFLLYLFQEFHEADSTKKILNFTRCSISIWLPPSQRFALIPIATSQRCSLTLPNEPRRRIQFRQSRTVVGRIHTGSKPAGRPRAERQPIQLQCRPESVTWIPKRPTASGSIPPGRRTSGCIWSFQSAARGSRTSARCRS